MVGRFCCDGARLKDEPAIQIVGADDKADAAKVRAEIDRLRKSGELSRIIESMGLSAQWRPRRASG